MTRPIDREIRALRAIHRALVLVDRQAQERVIRYWSDRVSRGWVQPETFDQLDKKPWAPLSKEGHA